MAINNSFEICYTGWCGRTAYGAIINGDAKSSRICTDYERFITNKKFDLHKINKKKKKKHNM